MNKYNRRSRPNLRHVCEFWAPSTTVNASGELTQEFTLHYRGPFSMEVPRSPNEINDADRTQSEQVFYLIGQWCQPAAQITAGMFCVIPRFQKVYAVSGPATDQWGDSMKLKINIVDNVAQPITIQLIPTLI